MIKYNFRELIIDIEGPIDRAINVVSINDEAYP